MRIKNNQITVLWQREGFSRGDGPRTEDELRVRESRWTARMTEFSQKKPDDDDDDPRKKPPVPDPDKDPPVKEPPDPKREPRKEPPDPKKKKPRLSFRSP